MLRYKDYRRLIDQVNAGKNINLWGKPNIGKTLTVKNCLLKDINLESVYLNLEYPFSVDHLFKVIPISFSFYYQQDWQNIISKLSDGYNKLLVIDNFDRLPRSLRSRGKSARFNQTKTGSEQSQKTNFTGEIS